MERLIFGILRYSLLKFVYVIDQSCHPLVVHPLLRKILDPPLPFVTDNPRTVWNFCKSKLIIIHTCSKSNCSKGIEIDIQLQRKMNRKNMKSVLTEQKCEEDKGRTKTDLPFSFQSL